MFTIIKGNDSRLLNFQKKLIDIANELREDWEDDDFHNSMLQEVHELSSKDSQYVFLLNDEVKFIYYKESIEKEYLKKDYQLLKVINSVIISGFISLPGESAFVFEQLSKEYPHLLLMQSEEFSYAEYENYYEPLSIEINDYVLNLYWNYLVIKNNNFIKETLTKSILNNYQIEFDSIEVKMFDMEKSEDKLAIDVLFLNELYARDKNSNTSKYLGFHYLDMNDICPYHQPKGLKLFIAIGKKGDIKKPLSVLKIAKYSYGENHDYFGLNYINTSFFYERKGLTKLLYQALNKFIESLNEEVLFISTDLSVAGKEANLDLVRRKYLTAKNCRQYDSNKSYREHYLNQMERENN